MPRLALAVVVLCSLDATAQLAVYPVSEIELRYAIEHPDAPPPERLLDQSIDGLVLAGGAALPPGGGPLLAREIAAITEGIRDELATRYGLLGHFVVPDPAQIDPDTGADLRAPGDRRLTILVFFASVGDTRTIGFGRRLRPDEDPINNPAHARIAAASPIATGELLRRPAIDRYLAKLNRDRGRLVEVAVAPTGTPGSVSLDYLINENRPWTLYAQVANTGTRSTDEIRTLFGARHRQFTNNDDTLRISYVTANFDGANASLGYERPLDDDGDVRLLVSASYNEYTASDVGLGIEAIEGDGLDFGLELAWNIAQFDGPDGPFVDAFAGARFRDIRVDNLLAGTEADTDLLLVNAGVRFEHLTDDANTTASIGVETSLPALTGADEDNLDLLGRPDVDGGFTVLRFDAARSFALEPLFTYGPPSRAHRLTVGLRGQWTPGARLIANEQVIAGGLFTVRGYEEAVASGDSAIIGTVEYRFGLSASLPVDSSPGTLFGRPFRATPQTIGGIADWDIGLRAFIDYAFVGNNDPAAFENDDELIGVGMGLDARLWTNLTARIDYAFALSDAPSATNPTDSGDSRLHFLVLVSY